VDTSTAPAPPAAEVLPRLEALARALAEAGLAATVEQGTQCLRVVNPQARDHTDRITCRYHPDDRPALWLFTSWQDPISPARDIRAAATRIRAILTPKSGARREA
jgi:hypothetical protein